jgi:hypothetical protein
MDVYPNLEFGLELVHVAAVLEVGFAVINDGRPIIRAEVLKL